MNDIIACLDDNEEFQTALRRAAEKYIRENNVGAPFVGTGNAVGNELQARSMRS